MSVAVGNVGGTLTGGSTVTLSYVGSPTSGKASFITSASSRLAPRQVDFLTSPARTTASDPGVARGGLKVTFGDRQTSEGCCTVQAGNVIIDLGVRWSLNQPEQLLDDAIELLQGLVFTTEFIAAVKKGALPG